MSLEMSVEDYYKNTDSLPSKTCRTCGETKIAQMFFPSDYRLSASECKECKRIYMRIYRRHGLISNQQHLVPERIKRVPWDIRHEANTIEWKHYKKTGEQPDYETDPSYVAKWAPKPQSDVMFKVTLEVNLEQFNQLKALGFL